ncbi:MAG: hypothetical protein F6K19_51230, partial [Cyanothece sp. SIO1E1]|nr:hypothetical protein [Cyanothece sp. SIO1E1]
KVLDLYLKPQLPPDITLFAPSEILQHGLPVLRVNQLESNQRQQLTLAFNGQAYDIMATQLFPQTYE